MTDFVLLALAVLAAALMLAYLGFRRRRAVPAVVFGLLLIGAFQAYLHLALDASIQGCIQRACASAGLAPDCLEAEFGCTEWSGLSVFVFYVTGMVQVALFAVGAGVMALLRARSDRGTPDPPAASPGRPPD